MNERKPQSFEDDLKNDVPINHYEENAGPTTQEDIEFFLKTVGTKLKPGDHFIFLKVNDQVVSIEETEGCVKEEREAIIFSRGKSVILLELLKSAIKQIMRKVASEVFLDFF